MKRLLLFALPLLMAACASDKDVYTYTIGPNLVDCYGVAPMKCMQVKKGNDTIWNSFYGKIEGFDYEPGYTYEMKVREEKIDNPPADGSSIRYVLVKMLSKKEN